MICHSVGLTDHCLFYKADAPFSPRGFHAATVFNGRLFILGGSPLSNEVWSANVVSAFSHYLIRVGAVFISVAPVDREEK